MGVNRRRKEGEIKDLKSAPAPTCVLDFVRHVMFNLLSQTIFFPFLTNNLVTFMFAQELKYVGGEIILSIKVMVCRTMNMLPEIYHTLTKRTKLVNLMRF